ncbi:MAG: sigma-70 family RNA polymerase sigma factor [Actinobacteria bacterium]|nr:sigma-70 family RNA polymerase sigma factor [Actinomycetota bacterium]
MSQSQGLSSDDQDEAEEVDLVEASAKGDEDAFRRLVERYQRLVTRVAFRSMGDMSLAEDVAQEAFIKVFRGLPAYQPEKPFVHWLMWRLNMAKRLLRKYLSAAGQAPGA